jgi:hypothetical protein
MLFKTSAHEALLRRARGEFREMPGMRLTIDQAARLWSADRQTCQLVLDALVASHDLAIDENGRYRKAHSDPQGSVAR